MHPLTTRYGGWPVSTWWTPLPTSPSTAALSLSLSLALALVVAPDTRAFAQASTATVRGVVVDPDGRVVPTATVSLTNPRTNQRRTAIADGVGAFTFAQVPPSTYVIEAAIAAFSPSLPSALTLNVGDELAVDRKSVV